MSEQEAPGSGPISWWVQLCRWLWRVLRYVWGALIASIAASSVANLLTGTTDTPSSKFIVIYIATTYPFPVVISIGGLLLITAITWVGSRERNPIKPLSPSQQNRLHMLGRLRRIYNDLLEQSLRDTVWLELGLASKPDAVQSASALLLYTPNQPERLISAGTSIVEVYEQAGRELLILGEPGAGKSTLLLYLARHLLTQAEQDQTLRLPVILPLSTWAEKRPALDIWLVEQLIQVYDVPRSLAHQWVYDEQVLPLLDGLDEMDEQARPACITAINTYHRAHLSPLVVCSRSNEYRAASSRKQLAFQTAVVVQPLTREQVRGHLAQAGRSLAGLRSALKKNQTLAALANTPLMMHTLMLTYQGTSVRVLPIKEALLRRKVWTDYVQYMIDNKGALRGKVRRYPYDQTIAWLSWLARQMRDHNQTIFYLEQLQPDWLPSKRRFFYQYGVAFIVGLLIVLFVALAWTLVIGLPLLFTRALSGQLSNNFAQGFLGGLLGTLPLGLLEGLMFGLFIGKLAIKPSEEVTWSWNDIQFRLLVGVST